MLIFCCCCVLWCCCKFGGVGFGGSVEGDVELLLCWSEVVDAQMRHLSCFLRLANPVGGFSQRARLTLD